MSWIHKNCGGEIDARIQGWASLNKEGKVSATFDTVLDYFACGICGEEFNNIDFKSSATWREDIPPNSK